MKEDQLIQLVEGMTADKKINQLLQLAAAFYSDKAEEKIGPMSELGLSQGTIDTAGITLGISGANETRHVQKEYMQNHRLNVSTLLMVDIIHGFRIILPIPLALGSTQDEVAIEKVVEISTEETAVSGLHVTFSPIADSVRDPHWGRVMGSTGEGPLLNSRLAAVMIRGYQGGNLKGDGWRIAAYVKHFAAYGGTLADRDYNTVDMSKWQLREMHLPDHRTGLNMGAKLAMTSLNTVDGIPTVSDQ